MTLKIKNWSRFQHFKDRSPPWIKLYRDLLDDIIWHELDAEAAKVLVMLWLIASEKDGILPESKELAFRLRITKKSLESIVTKLNHWLIQDDINVISDINTISDGYQHDTPHALAREREETETETEGEKSPTPMGMLIALNVEKNIAKDWLTIRKAKRAPLTETALEELKREAEKAGISPADAVFICAKKSWQNFNASWKWQDSMPAKPGNAMDDFMRKVGAIPS